MKFTIAPDALAGFGLSVKTLCERAGVALADEWETDDFFRLWHAVEGEIRERWAGLRFGAEGIARGYAVPALVALHAPDLRHALAALARYKRLTCPELVEFEINVSETLVRYRWLQASGPTPRLLVDTTMASLHEMVRRGTAGQVAPIRIELARRAADDALLQQHFGCSVVFGASSDAMVFATTALEVPFITADGGAFARLVEGLEKNMLDEESYSAFVGEVRVVIARQLSEGRACVVEAVANRLRTSGRTLQRHLAECGTTFQQQLDGVRRSTAHKLLTNTQFDIVAIAMLLGFVEPNSFIRAFRIWEHTTPIRWRARHAVGNSP